MRSDLFGTNLESATTDRFTLQNPRMLRVALDGEVMARQGAMVAYQGQVDFAYQGSGGMGKLFKKAFTGEGMSLMKVSGQGDVFFADDAMEIHLVNLENDALTVNGSNVLAFDSTLTWDIKRVEGASMMAGGVFNTTFTGTGTVAITSHGTPVVLNVDAPTYADIQAAVAWSTSLTTSVRRTAGASALIGRGSGEAFQLVFNGQGFVVVQASEGRIVAPHTPLSGALSRRLGGVARVGQDVATHCHAAGSSLRHGRPVVPDHQGDGECPSPAAQPGRVVDADLPPEQLPGGGIKYFPGHHKVDGRVADRQAPEVQDRGQSPVTHQQVLGCQVAVVPARRRTVCRSGQLHGFVPDLLGGVEVEIEVLQGPATLDVLSRRLVHRRERLASVRPQVRVVDRPRGYLRLPQGVQDRG